MNSLEIGHSGEQAAQQYLLKNGFELLHSNWRNGRYELDIVASKDGMLHVIEVKTRKADSLTPPEMAMTRKKFKSLCKAADFYIQLYHIDSDVQFDLICVDYENGDTYNIRYIPDVMSAIW